MTIESITSVIPVDDLPAAVKTWTALLGVAPTFADGDKWAQFDVAGRRIALAGTDRFSDSPSVMIKVSDLTEARRRAVEQGLQVGAISDGAHEQRLEVRTPGGWPVTFYAPRSR